MRQKLVIELSEEATAKYLFYAGRKTGGEVNADCEPSGSTIAIEIAPSPYDCSVYMMENSIAIGEANVELITVNKEYT
ncbi:MAG: hypothetical protein ACPG52_00380 [Cognaticolwellia sp.]